MTKGFLLRLLLTMVIAAIAPVVPAQRQAAPEKPFTVIIDPGHGGKDIGCRGKLTNEKTIVLDVSRRLGELIKAEHPEVNVIYTRSDDRFIALNDRAVAANKASADLFISIHVNSVDAKTRGRENIHGASVYTLGLHRNDDNLAVAMRENSVIELENDFTETYQGFDPNSSESYIIFELTQNRHQQNSIELADRIERELVGTAGRASKGVRQAGFLVLRATSMPAVLVELDFICNPAAERFLHSADGKEKCARSIADAFTAYYSKHGQSATGTPAQTAPAAGNAAPAANPDAVYYCIQFLSSPSQVDPASESLKDMPDATYYIHENTYKYISGRFDSLKAAKKELRKIKKRFPDAFIIKMRNGERVAQ